MAIYSTNQVRHVYVADATSTCVQYPDGSYKMFFKNAKGETVASDLITNIEYAKETATSQLIPKTKTVDLMLNPEVNGGAPVAGQDYIVKFIINNFVSLGEESKYIKTVAVRATKGMDADKFYRALFDAIDKSFSREEVPFIIVRPNVEGEGPTAKFTSLLIIGAAQPWELGVKPFTVTDFDIVVSPITVGGMEEPNPFVPVSETVRYKRLIAPNEDDDVLSASKILADLEYFSLGSRGDVYRNMGWPYVRPSKGMVDPETEYTSVIDIHYSYVGSNESVQKSEKDITIIVPDGVNFKSVLTSAGITVK